MHDEAIQALENHKLILEFEFENSGSPDIERRIKEVTHTIETLEKL